ncbi:MAG TPA: hypothetical protein VJN96_19270 [Vicinamibacterales bacterium]|nr:hypothetical protein [Vicinamibacterales bacterium]
MSGMQRVTKTGILAVLVMLAGATQARAQFARQPPAELPAVDVVASLPWTQIPATAGAERHWSGPGFALGVDGNVNKVVAIATNVERFTPGGVAWLGGLQLSTAFEYGSGRDPVPGRYFAKFLAGVSSGRSVQTRGLGQVDVGFDILTTLRPVGVHVEVGYDLVPGDPVHHAYGRVAVGIIFGPKI